MQVSRTYLFFSFLTVMACTARILPASVYVSTSGNDSDPGTAEKPFRTLSRASRDMQGGDTCFISSGTYRETFRPHCAGQAGKPAVFMALPGHEVRLSAMDPLVGGTEADGCIRFRIEKDLGIDNMVTCNGVPMILARWPNKKSPDPMEPEAAVINKDKSSPVALSCKMFPGSWDRNSLEGATVWVSAECKWSSWTSHVKYYDAGSRTIILRGFGDNWWIDNHHNPSRIIPDYGESRFYVAGALKLLDAPGEWYLDRDQHLLMIIPPANARPENCRFEIKQRTLTADLSDCSGIELVNISFHGAPPVLKGASHCVIRGGSMDNFCSVFGLNSTKAAPNITGVILGGSRNTIRDCEIHGSFGSGVLLSGEYNALINCYIHDINYLGAGNCAPVVLSGAGHLVSCNTIAHTGRECIRISGGGHIIEHNLVSDPGRICRDLGALKTGWTDADNTVIRYNVIHNDNGKFIGIYLDSYTDNIIVHHNIINGMREGIRNNRPGHYQIVYNNTVAPDITDRYGPWQGARDQHGNVLVNNVYRDKITAKPEVYRYGNIREDFTPDDSLIRPVSGHRTAGSDFPAYAGAIPPGGSVFQTGYNLTGPSEENSRKELPFIRNHLRNGSFDLVKTYKHSPEFFVQNDLDPELAFWESTEKKKPRCIFVAETSGYLDVSNPEFRNCINDYSLCLDGIEDMGVRQSIPTLVPGRNYVFAAYLKSPDDAKVRFTISSKGKILADLSSDTIPFPVNSNWKFVYLEFNLPPGSGTAEVRIVKIGKGSAYIDDTGVIPIPDRI